jgi:hypothetical protein
MYKFDSIIQFYNKIYKTYNNMYKFDTNNANFNKIKDDFDKFNDEVDKIKDDFDKMMKEFAIFGNFTKITDDTQYYNILKKYFIDLFYLSENKKLFGSDIIFKFIYFLCKKKQLKLQKYKEIYDKISDIEEYIDIQYHPYFIYTLKNKDKYEFYWLQNNPSELILEPLNS